MPVVRIRIDKAYRHDRCADKNPYRHDRRGYKNPYRHDRRADSQCHTFLRIFYAFGLQITHYESQSQNYAHEKVPIFNKFSSI